MGRRPLRRPRPETCSLPAPSARSTHYPDALPALAEQFPPGPVLYTGGLENHPRVVAELAAKRELWGNPPRVLERVRDPYRLQAVLAPMSSCRGRLTPAPSPGGGCESRSVRVRAGIRFARSGRSALATPLFSRSSLTGTPVSAVYVDACVCSA